MNTLERRRRYIATPRVRAEILAQGRRFDWIADQAGVSKSHLTRVLSGERPVDEFTGRIVSALLGRDFSLLWKVDQSTESVDMAPEALAS